MIKKALKLSLEDYIKKHLEIINVFLPIKLTEKEIEVIGAFMAIEDIDKFSSNNKKVVSGKLGIAMSNLSMYINKLIEKGFIIKIDDRLEVLPILYPSNGYQEYMFRVEVIK